MRGLIEALEADAIAASLAAPNMRVDEVADLSVAISLKQIADALDGTALGVDISESLAGLTLANINGRSA